MSQYLDSLNIGDTLEVRGPVGEFEYQSDGSFTIEGCDDSVNYHKEVSPLIR
jgi:hypothetical protein